jgi:hypothetical protein
MTSIVDPPCFSRQARPLPPPLVIAPAPQQRLGYLATTIVDGDECRPAHALPVELIAQEDVMRCFFVCVCHELWPVFPCNAVYSSSRSPGSLLAERGGYSESTIRRVPSPRLDKPRPEGSCMRLESQRHLDAETALSISTRGTAFHLRAHILPCIHAVLLHWKPSPTPPIVANPSSTDLIVQLAGRRCRATQVHGPACCTVHDWQNKVMRHGSFLIN